ncbi:hypothetical protein DFP73DRAFT_599290 [Morchella snyderi]|nr:hypothetical protein DFP73DRAFT_599290 [Morchella snyderi]
MPSSTLSSCSSSAPPLAASPVKTLLSSRHSAAAAPPPDTFPSCGLNYPTVLVHGARSPPVSVVLSLRWSVSGAGVRLDGGRGHNAECAAAARYYPTLNRYRMDFDFWLSYGTAEARDGAVGAPERLKTLAGVDESNFVAD